MNRETRHLKISNVPESFSDEKILEYFSNYGKVQRVEKLEEGAEGSVMVSFIDLRTAAKAKASDHRIDGTELTACYYHPDTPGTSVLRIVDPTPTPEASSSSGNGSRPGNSGGGNSSSSNGNSSSSRSQGKKRIEAPIQSRIQHADNSLESFGYHSDLRSPPSDFHFRRHSTTSGGNSRASWRGGSSGNSSSNRWIAPDPPSSDRDRDRIRHEESNLHSATPSTASGSSGASSGGSKDIATPGISSVVVKASSSNSSGGLNHNSWEAQGSKNRLRQNGGSATEGTGSSRRSRRKSESSGSSRKNSRSPSQRSSPSCSPNPSVTSSRESRKVRSVCLEQDRLRADSESPVNGDHDPSSRVGLIVRNLPVRSTDSSIKDGLFFTCKKLGKVLSVKVVGEGDTRYGIVIFRKGVDLSKAIDQIDNEMFFGSQMRVEAAPSNLLDADDNEKKPLEKTIDGHHPRSSRTLYVGNLDPRTTESQLKDRFGQFGFIVDVDIKNRDTPAPYAFVQFADITSVVKAIQETEANNAVQSESKRMKVGFGKTLQSTIIWLDELPEQVDEEYLRRKMKMYGETSDVLIDNYLHQALVTFNTVESAMDAVKQIKARTRTIGNVYAQVDYGSAQLNDLFIDRMYRSKHLSSSGKLASVVSAVPPPSPRVPPTTQPETFPLDSNSASVSEQSSSRNQRGHAKGSGDHSSGNSWEREPNSSRDLNGSSSSSSRHRDSRHSKESSSRSFSQKAHSVVNSRGTEIRSRNQSSSLHNSSRGNNTGSDRRSRRDHPERRVNERRGQRSQQKRSSDPQRRERREPRKDDHNPRDKERKEKSRTRSSSGSSSSSDSSSESSTESESSNEEAKLAKATTSNGPVSALDERKSSKEEATTAFVVNPPGSSKLSLTVDTSLRADSRGPSSGKSRLGDVFDLGWQKHSKDSTSPRRPLQRQGNVSASFDETDDIADEEDMKNTASPDVTEGPVEFRKKKLKNFQPRKSGESGNNSPTRGRKPKVEEIRSMEELSKDESISFPEKKISTEQALDILQKGLINEVKKKMDQKLDCAPASESSETTKVAPATVAAKSQSTVTASTTKLKSSNSKSSHTIPIIPVSDDDSSQEDPRTGRDPIEATVDLPLPKFSATVPLTTKTGATTPTPVGSRRNTTDCIADDTFTNSHGVLSRSASGGLSSGDEHLMLSPEGSLSTPTAGIFAGSKSPGSPGRPSLEERIKALDAKFSALERDMQAAKDKPSAPGGRSVDYSKFVVKKKPNSGKDDDIKREPSPEPIKSIYKSSIFDRDMERLKSIEDKYTPRTGGLYSTANHFKTEDDDLELDVSLDFNSSTDSISMGANKSKTEVRSRSGSCTDKANYSGHSDKEKPSLHINIPSQASSIVGDSSLRLPQPPNPPTTGLGSPCASSLLSPPPLHGILKKKGTPNGPSPPAAGFMTIPPPLPPVGPPMFPPSFNIPPPPIPGGGIHLQPPVPPPFPPQFQGVPQPPTTPTDPRLARKDSMKSPPIDTGTPITLPEPPSFGSSGGPVTPARPPVTPTAITPNIPSSAPPFSGTQRDSRPATSWNAGSQQNLKSTPSRQQSFPQDPHNKPPAKSAYNIDPRKWDRQNSYSGTQKPEKTFGLRHDKQEAKPSLFPSSGNFAHNSSVRTSTAQVAKVGKDHRPQKELRNKELDELFRKQSLESESRKETLKSVLPKIKKKEKPVESVFEKFIPVQHEKPSVTPAPSTTSADKNESEKKKTHKIEKEPSFKSKERSKEKEREKDRVKEKKEDKEERVKEKVEKDKLSKEDREKEKNKLHKLEKQKLKQQLKERDGSKEPKESKHKQKEDSHSKLAKAERKEREREKEKEREKKEKEKAEEKKKEQEKAEKKKPGRKKRVQESSSSEEDSQESSSDSDDDSKVKSFDMELQQILQAEEYVGGFSLYDRIKRRRESTAPGQMTPMEELIQSQKQALDRLKQKRAEKEKKGKRRVIMSESGGETEEEEGEEEEGEDSESDTEQDVKETKKKPKHEKGDRKDKKKKDKPAPLNVDDVFGTGSGDDDDLDLPEDGPKKKPPPKDASPAPSSSHSETSKKESKKQVKEKLKEKENHKEKQKVTEKETIKRRKPSQSSESENESDVQVVQVIESEMSEARKQKQKDKAKKAKKLKEKEKKEKDRSIDPEKEKKEMSREKTKEKSKEKEKAKQKDKEKEKEKDKEKMKEKQKEKEKEKEKDKEKEKEKEKEEEKELPKEKEKEKEKLKERGKDKHKEKENEEEKETEVSEKQNETEKGKAKETESHNKEKDSEKPKETEKNRSKDEEGVSKDKEKKKIKSGDKERERGRPKKKKLKTLEKSDEDEKNESKETDPIEKSDKTDESAEKDKTEKEKADKSEKKTKEEKMRLKEEKRKRRKAKEAAKERGDEHQEEPSKKKRKTEATDEIIGEAKDDKTKEVEPTPKSDINSISSPPPNEVKEFETSKTLDTNEAVPSHLLEAVRQSADDPGSEEPMDTEPVPVVEGPEVEVGEKPIVCDEDGIIEELIYQGTTEDTSSTKSEPDTEESIVKAPESAPEEKVDPPENEVKEEKVDPPESEVNGEMETVKLETETTDQNEDAMAAKGIEEAPEKEEELETMNPGTVAVKTEETEEITETADPVEEPKEAETSQPETSSTSEATKVLEEPMAETKLLETPGPVESMIDHKQMDQQEKEAAVQKTIATVLDSVRPSQSHHHAKITEQRSGSSSHVDEVIDDVVHGFVEVDPEELIRKAAAKSRTPAKRSPAATERSVAQPPSCMLAGQQLAAFPQQAQTQHQPASIQMNTQQPQQQQPQNQMPNNHQQHSQPNNPQQPSNQQAHQHPTAFSSASSILPQSAEVSSATIVSLAAAANRRTPSTTSSLSHMAPHTLGNVSVSTPTANPIVSSTVDHLLNFPNFSNLVSTQSSAVSQLQAAAVASYAAPPHAAYPGSGTNAAALNPAAAALYGGVNPFGMSVDSQRALLDLQQQAQAQNWPGLLQIHPSANNGRSAGLGLPSGFDPTSFQFQQLQQRFALDQQNQQRLAMEQSRVAGLGLPNATQLAHQQAQLLQQQQARVNTPSTSLPSTSRPASRPVQPPVSEPAQAPQRQQQPQQQNPSQDSAVNILQKYPVKWQGLLALKTDQALTQMHFIDGNKDLIASSLPPVSSNADNAIVRISQRMRLEPQQLDGVQKRMQHKEEHCVLLALPCGRSPEDIKHQTKILQDGFISYLQQKQAAGIVHIEVNHQTTFVVHIFPPCEFSDNHLEMVAPDFIRSVRERDTSFLFIVITTVHGVI